MKRIFLLIIAIILTQTPTLALGNECTAQSQYDDFIKLSHPRLRLLAHPNSNEYIWLDNKSYEIALNAFNTSIARPAKFSRPSLYECGEKDFNCIDGSILPMGSGHVWKGDGVNTTAIYACVEQLDGDLWVQLHKGDYSEIPVCTDQQKNDWEHTTVLSGRTYKVWFTQRGGEICLAESEQQDPSNDDPVDSKNNDRQQCLTTIKADLVDVITKKLEKKPNKVEITAQEMATLFKKHKEKCKDYLEKHKNDNNPIKISEAELNFSMKDVYEYFTK